MPLLPKTCAHSCILGEHLTRDVLHTTVWKALHFICLIIIQFKVLQHWKQYWENSQLCETFDLWASIQFLVFSISIYIQ